MKGHYIFNSRIFTHISFWIIYYVGFGAIWAYNSAYWQSYFLEFILLPMRILAVYISIYVLIPKYLQQKKVVQFVAMYSGLVIICGILQRLFIHLFYEGIVADASRSVFDLTGIIRSTVLVNSTVIFVTAIKITQLWYKEQSTNSLLIQNFGTLTDEKIQEEIVEIKSDKRIFRVPTDKILFIEGLGNYAIYHLKDQKIISYVSMKEIIKTLPEHFIRVHKSFIVNKNQIRSYNNEDLEINGKFIPIGRSFKDEVKI